MSDTSIRLIVFLSVLSILSVAEVYLSYKPRELARKKRWLGNLALPLISSAFLKLLIPAGAIGFAVWAQDNNYGLLNYFAIPSSLPTIIISVIFLDLVIYFQHVLTHRINILWRFHRVHHSDVDLDATSALRFHPIEIVFSIIYKGFFIILWGASPEAVLAFEILLNAMAMFNHSNLAIPDWLEPKLRWFIVTPKMHLVHHSVVRSEHDRNYGFSLSIWDRLFKTYVEKFKGKERIGLNCFRSAEEQSPLQLFIQPLRKSLSGK